MISLNTFRAVVSNSTIGKNEALTFGDENKTVICGLNGQKRSLKVVDDIELKQNAIYMRSSLLSGIRDTLGLREDSATFKKFEKLIFGDLVDGQFDADAASKPLAKREIKTILDVATREQYKAETYDLETGMDYAKHKNQVGLVFSFGQTGGDKSLQSFVQSINLKKISQPGFVNKITAKHLAKGNKGEDLIDLGVAATLNELKGSGKVPEQFAKDLFRSAGGFIMPDGTMINPHGKDRDVLVQELYDRFTEKITNGRVRHYADLTGKDLKLVQFTMAMMNQRPMAPMACLEQDLLNDDSRMLMVTNSNIGYQVSVNADGSMTFKGFTHGNVTGISNGIGIDIVTDKEKSDVGYSFEITFSAKSIDRILEHDWTDPSVSWVKADKREFFFTCHLEA